METRTVIVYMHGYFVSFEIRMHKPTGITVDDKGRYGQHGPINCSSILYNTDTRKDLAVDKASKDIYHSLNPSHIARNTVTFHATHTT